MPVIAPSSGPWEKGKTLKCVCPQLIDTPLRRRVTRRLPYIQPRLRAAELEPRLHEARPGAMQWHREFHLRLPGMYPRLPRIREGLGRRQNSCLQLSRLLLRSASNPHFLNPACFRVLPKVPGARSSLGLPATVTRPGFAECLDWRRLPLVATRNHPSSASNLRISLTFIRQA